MRLLKEAVRSLDIIHRDAALNVFTYIRPSECVLADIKSAEDRVASGAAISAIDGCLIAVKDNICTGGIPTTCGSHILQDFLPPYNATAVSRLSHDGAVIVGKTNMDEFGMGSHSVTGAFGPVKMPSHGLLGDRSAGGSSGGSAVAVALYMCFAALGSDTGGSVRLPAAYCSIVGFKPSYGMVSRQGLITYANSLDTIGVLARRVDDAKSVFDPSSLGPEPRARILQLAKQRRRNRKPSVLRVGVPKEFNIIDLSPSVRRAWKSAVVQLRAMGHTVRSVSLPSLRHALPAYYTLAPAEASSNLAKYDGFRYGGTSGGEEVLKPETPQKASRFFKISRAQGLGPEVRRRILLGTYSLSAEAFDNYFIQAQKLRRLLIQDFDRAFAFPNVLSPQSPTNEVGGAQTKVDGVDFLLCPSTMTDAPSLEQALSQRSSPLENYVNDYFTVPASMAGIPAISIPSRTIGTGAPAAGNTPAVGLQIMTQYGDEEMLFDAANILERLGTK